MRISIKTNVKQVTKDLNKIQKKQIPFATMLALNDVAFGSRKELQKQSHKKLDRPTPFTVKGFQVVKAKKRELTSIVYVDSKRYDYMKHQIDGGIRFPKNRAIPVPTRNLRVNKYGNMPRRKIETLLAKKNTFSGTPRGGGKNANATPGVWQRTNKNYKLKQLVSYVQYAKYTPRFNFEKIVKGYVGNTFNKHMEKRLNAALATAR
jgi:hypothetical protein